MTPRSARALLWITWLGSPILLACYLGTTWDATALRGGRFWNPVAWGTGNVFDALALLAAGEGRRVVADVVAFWRSDPWGNWVLIDHAGLKVLLCFLLSLDARASGRRAWPYNLAIWVVGALAPLLYMLPVLRAAAAPARARTVSAVATPPAAAVEVAR